MSAELSGRVNTLESQMTQVFQELLLKAGLGTLSDYQTTINTQLDSFSTNQNTHETRIDNLEGLYAGIAFNFNSHIADFSGHTGATTGQGVHGHT